MIKKFLTINHRISKILYELSITLSVKELLHPRLEFFDRYIQSILDNIVLGLT